MYCNKCGHELPEGSRFCNSCGAAIVESSSPIQRAGSEPLERRAKPYPPVAQRGYGDALPQYSDAADERVLFVLRPTLIFVTVWYLAAAFIVIVAAAVMGILSKSTGQGAAIIVILIVAAVAFAIPIYKHIVRRREVYTLTNHKLEMRYGLISKTIRNIPLRNIQDVTVTATVPQRLLKLGNILIDSASESGKIRLSEVHRPEKYADMILGVLRQRY